MPYPSHCRVLEHLFGYPVDELLSPASQASEQGRGTALVAFGTTPAALIAPGVNGTSGVADMVAGDWPGQDAALGEAVVAARKQAGRELARLRHVAGLNQQQLANRIGYSRGQVAGAEAGTNSTAVEFWRVCDEVLGTGGGLVAAREQVEAALTARRDAAVRRDEANREARLQQWRVNNGLPPAEPAHGTALVPATAPDGAMLIAPPDPGNDVERRELLKGIGSFIAGAILNPRLNDLVTSEPHALLRTLGTNSIDAMAMEYYDAATEELGLRFPTVAPLVLLDATVECFSAVRQFLEMRSTFVQHRRLCWLAARLAGLTGVILHETNDHTNAKAWFAAADKAARESEDHQLRAWVLVKKALIPTYTGQPVAVLRLMDEAASLIPHGRGVVAARVYANAARAYAAMGSPNDFETSMDRARAALEQAPKEDRRGGVFCFTEKQLAFYTGTCYIRLEQPAAARAVIHDAIGLYRRTEVMDPAIMRIDIAVSHFQEGEIEEACRWALQAIDVPTRYRNGSLLQRTVELQQALRPHKDVALVREFNERFRHWTMSA